MEAANRSVELLQQQILDTEKELERLRAQLAEAEQVKQQFENQISNHENSILQAQSCWPLSPEEYTRYGRQMIVPSVGIEGQQRIRSASVLIVGAGGLGCPAAAYIAGAGVKTLGIIDGDTVEVSNLHRQILHSTSTVGLWKVDSAIQSLRKLNPHVEYKAYREHLSPENALDIISQYDLVLDCTDHPRPRYIISDACVLLQKPLVSASALQTDGQLIVLNNPPQPQGSSSGGPCYRCVFPKPPPADSVVSCGEGGILGPVVGTMGVLQALEAIKVIVSGSSKDTTSTQQAEEIRTPPAPTMLLFSATSSTPFRAIKLRSRRPECFACSAKAGLTRESMTSGSLDYVAFCGLSSPVNLLSPEERISASEYSHIHDRVGKDHVLIDTREKVHFDIANIDGSINVPFSKFHGQGISAESWLSPSLPSDTPIYVVCRLGNDSQVVTRKLKENGLDNGGRRYIGDIKGGLKAWKDEVDQTLPYY